MATYTRIYELLLQAVRPLRGELAAAVAARAADEAEEEAKQRSQRKQLAEQRAAKRAYQVAARQQADLLRRAYIQQLSVPPVRQGIIPACHSSRSIWYSYPVYRYYSVPSLRTRTTTYRTYTYTIPR